MKTIQLIILLSGLFFTTNTIFAQDDFYNNSKKAKKSTNTNATHDSLAVDIFDESSYMSEEEYYEMKYGSEENYAEEDRIYSENEIIIEEQHRKVRNRQIAGEIVAEIFYNVALSVLIIWGSR